MLSLWNRLTRYPQTNFLTEWFFPYRKEEAVLKKYFDTYMAFSKLQIFQKFLLEMMRAIWALGRSYPISTEESS